MSCLSPGKFFSTDCRGTIMPEPRTPAAVMSDDSLVTAQTDPTMSTTAPSEPLAPEIPRLEVTEGGANPAELS